MKLCSTRGTACRVSALFIYYNLRRMRSGDTDALLIGVKCESGNLGNQMRDTALAFAAFHLLNSV